MTEKRKPGRPPLPFPEPINRPMDEIARVVLNAPPKRDEEWKYLREHRAKRDARRWRQNWWEFMFRDTRGLVHYVYRGDQFRRDYVEHDDGGSCTLADHSALMSDDVQEVYMFPPADGRGNHGGDVRADRAFLGTTNWNKVTCPRCRAVSQE